MSKVYSIVMKVRLDCEICYKKITKAICSICICDLQSKIFDEKANTITITGTFDPDMVMKKLCRKAGRWIISYEVIEIVKEEEPPPAPAKEPEPEPAPAPEPKPAPAPEPAPAPAPPPKEDEKPGKDSKKKTKKKGGSLQVVVVVPPPAATAAQPEKKPPPPDPAPMPDPAPDALAPEPPPPKLLCEPPVVAVPYPAPVTGVPFNWWGPCQCGCYHRGACCGVHDHPPCTCSCSCGSRHGHCGHNCVFFSEKDSMCRPM